MGRYENIAFCALLFYCSVVAAQVTSSPPAHERRGDGASDVNMTSSLSRDQMQFLSNHTDLNSTESDATAVPSSGMETKSPAPVWNIGSSENITDSLNGSDGSPVNNKTRVITVMLTTLLPSATHDPRSTIRPTTFRPTPTAAGITAPPAASGPGSTTKRKSSPTTAAATTAAVTAQMATSSSPMQARARLDTPSALNVGDEVLDINPKVPSDPLLAGLVSAFVVIAALVSVLIFLKFRNRNGGPEFSRLHDLPMDDMLEDSPLSTYSY